MSTAPAPPPPAFAHRYVVIEGPIGVGKTSLARRLAAQHGAELVLERAEENPFLERFYRSPRTGAFPAQLYFLFQRARQMQMLRQSDLFAPVRVADFLLEKDRLFARVTLDDEEYALYEQVYERLAIDAPVPDLVVYLQAPADVLQERVARRGIRYEQGMEREYLERLVDAYTRFFHLYDAGPLLIVNAAEVDFVGNEAHFAQLEAEVNRPRRGRHYFNPFRG
ncbi:MAG TPA: deoxynucleoside kinase [Steroidobacteraceae bacterium]|nr:deoxynucleoside kinase [Steroidobacteraceae bacterium]